MVNSTELLRQYQASKQSFSDEANSPKTNTLLDIFIQNSVTQLEDLLTEHKKMNQTIIELANICLDTTTSIEAKYYEMRGILKGGFIK